MGEKLNIKIILGSTRPQRFSEYSGRWILGLAKEQGGAEFELLDLRDYRMPFYDEAQTPSDARDIGHDKEAVKKWAAKIDEADGFIIIAPEYNHGIPAVLKNALDYVWYPWNKKPVAFVGHGNAGGARSIEQLREVAVELELVSIRPAIHISSPYSLRNKDGTLKDGALDSYADKGKKMLEELLWWARVLKNARDQK